MKRVKNNNLKFKDSDDAVVGIVVTLMIIGLFITAIAYVQNVFVPQWMQKKESEHMDQVANQFAQLKSSVDTLSSLDKPNIQISVPVTLGSDEIPFLTSSRSYGSLNLKPNDFKITIKDKNNDTLSYILGSIEYISANSYYRNLEYIYENGALILSQPPHNIFIINPSLSIINGKDLYIDLIKLIGLTEKTSASGYSTCPIQAKFSSSQEFVIYSVEKIIIRTTHKDAWINLFNDQLSKSGILFSINDIINNEGFEITFYDTDNTDLPDMTLNIFEIKIQISTGWIE